MAIEDSSASADGRLTLTAAPKAPPVAAASVENHRRLMIGGGELPPVSQPAGPSNDGPGFFREGQRARAVTETTGWAGGVAPREPEKGRSLKLKIPPSAATIR